MFGITGAGLSVAKYYSNDHKKARWNRDAWDRVSRIYAPFTQSADPTNISIAKYVLASELSIIDVNAKVLIWDAVMARDLRITGSIRGQSSNPEAPVGFDVSNPWQVCTSFPDEFVRGILTLLEIA
jgi:hypothetical protein